MKPVVAWARAKVFAVMKSCCCINSILARIFPPNRHILLKNTAIIALFRILKIT